MKTLIVYPHGIGDIILATPALRAFKEKVGFMMLNRLISSEILTHCPYVEKVYGCPDPHNDYEGNVMQGIHDVQQRAVQLAREEGFERLAYLDHTIPHNKIYLNLDKLGIPHKTESEEFYRTEVFLSQEDRDFAKEFVGDRKFTFIHGSSPSLPPKDFPKDFLKSLRKDKDVIEVGVDFLPTAFDINKQFAIMELASEIYVIDSAFYHAAHALGKDVDLAYFNRGKEVYDRVRPLHTVKEKICYEI
tara:strand:+ start:755 stop:1492 length:738 start_codon:yes stop_codon:yes gene_type:complete